MFGKKEIAHFWDGIIPPFRIIGNVYFVGNYAASSHLIDTGEGLILIDTGYENTLYLLIHSIYSLGFRPQDIKYIIHSHWHKDHTAATAPLVGLVGAKTFIGELDAPKAQQFFNPDVLLHDGDVVSLGNTAIRCMHTPGHTQGCMSFFFDTTENGKTYKVGTFGGAGANTLQRGCFDYDDCRAGYLDSLNRLRKEKVDVFIGNHVWNNNTDVNGKILRETGENRFINDKIWLEFLDYRERILLDLIEKEKTLR